jgi:hypothetical protein
LELVVELFEGVLGQANDSNAFNFTFMSKVSSRKPKRQWGELCKVWLARGSKVTYKAVKQ